MTTLHRYTLEPYKTPKSRYACPECNHRNKTFKRYIDTQTDQYLADHVGRCDREDQCGYHYTPRQYFAANAHHTPIPALKVRPSKPADKGFNCIAADLLNDSLAQKAYIDNNFILFLKDVFGWAKAIKAAGRYKIGTAKHWPGATVFWQIDTKGRVRTGKIMLYDKSTGKRVKQPFNHVTWVHGIVGKSGSPQDGKQEYRESYAHAVNPLTDFPTSGLPDFKPIHLTDSRTSGLSVFKLKQCLFGEHLLGQDTTATVAIAESEKTAIMASIMMPQFIWLAAGSLHGLDEDKCRALANRTVLLFPDVGAYTLWTERAQTLNLKIPTATFDVHPKMERTATPEERASGADMADRWIAEWVASCTPCPTTS